MNILRIITTKPWLSQGAPEESPDPGEVAVTTAKIGLGLFLAVVTSVFGLFLSAYHMRAEYADWLSLTDPGVLWLNTALLIFASVAFERARVAARDGRIEGVKLGLTTGGVLTFAFLVGQLWAWQQLSQAGLYAATNPANAFFYVLTGVHGLHLIGGLYVWARTTAKVWLGLQLSDVVEVGNVRLSVELCAIYWHFLLLVWLVVFGLLLST